MQIDSLIQVLSAAHLTVHVADEGYRQRGGIMLVAPPSSFKSTAIGTLKAFEPRAHAISDLNMQTLIKMREAISSGSISTLAFPEFEKLYMRHESTSSNIEGTIKLLVEEGFRHGSYEDQRMMIAEARCLVVGGITRAMYAKNYTKWEENGFLRRFLWCHYRLHDPQVLIRAAHRWEQLKIATDPLIFGVPPSNVIPYRVTPTQSEEIQHMLAKVDTAITPFVLLKKILCVLVWRYPPQTYGNKAWDILRDFGSSLRDVVDLTVDEPKESVLAESNGYAAKGLRVVKARESRKTKSRETS